MLLPIRVTTLLVNKVNSAFGSLPNETPSLLVNKARPLLGSIPSRAATLLVSKANPLLKIAHKVVPKLIQNQGVLYGVNLLAREFVEQGEMDFMQDKVARVEIKDLELVWHFTKRGDKLVMIDAQPKPDVTFAATLEACVLMASQKVDPDTLFFNRSLLISGDTELGLEIKNLIDQFDIELLPKPARSVLDMWSNKLLENQHV